MHTCNDPMIVRKRAVYGENQMCPKSSFLGAMQEQVIVLYQFSKPSATPVLISDGLISGGSHWLCWNCPGPISGI